MKFGFVRLILIFSTAFLCEVGFSQDTGLCEEIAPKVAFYPDQQSTGNCYAWGLSFMSTALNKQPMSALDIVFQYNAWAWPETSSSLSTPPFRAEQNDLLESFDDNPPLHMAGSIRGAWSAIRQAGGFCPESVTRSQNMGTDIYFVLQSITKLFAPTKKQIHSSDELSDALQNISNVFRNLTPHDALQIIGSEYFWTNTWKALADQNCPASKRWMPAGLTLRSLPLRSPIYEIDTELQRGNFVGVAYPASAFLIPRAFSNKKSATTTAAYNLLFAVPILKELFPASIQYSKGISSIGVVVGSRRNKQTGQCQYAIQDTHGASCSRVSVQDCNNGLFWVNRSRLAEVAIEADVLSLSSRLAENSDNAQ